MTTGLDDGVPDVDCMLPSCMIYKADAGTRWAYHNAPYTILDKSSRMQAANHTMHISRQKLETRLV